MSLSTKPHLRGLDVPAPVLQIINRYFKNSSFDYLDGKMELDSAINLIKQNTRRYAKRQLTWFRRDEEIKWFEPGNETDILNYIKDRVGE